jgi:hypothetical protein
MIKKLLAISLAACSLSASAQTEQTWNFVWSGPFAFGMNRTIADATYTGSFSAIDGDHDGLIVASELTRLVIDGSSVAPCTQEQCTVEEFSYSGGNQLTIEARWSNSYEAWPEPPSTSREHWMIASGGGGWESVYCNQMCNDWSWASAEPGATLTVTAAVPEPETYLMLTAGLMGMGYLAKRRQRAGKSS